MTFLPIVERELRVAARRRGTYWMRLRNAGLATLAFAAGFTASQFAPSIPFGKTLFIALSGLCLVYSLAAGRMMTADCLSREKREGTLGLLFLTDLNGYDVVLGKLAATSLDGFYGLLAVFPLLAIPLLSGGMTNGELWRTALVLVNTFLFSLAVGIFVSALCRDEQKAMAGNFGLLLLLAALPPALDGVVMMAGTTPRPMTHEFFYSCPVYSLCQAADTQYKKSPEHFWSSIGITFNLTLCLVFLACRIAPRAWQDKPISSRTLKKKGERRWRWWREGRREKAEAFRRKLLDVNAYFWLAGRPYLKVSYVWTAMLCLGIWFVFTSVLVGHLDDAVNFGMAFLLNGMLKLWIITEAGHQLAADKRSGAFELLLSTPLTAADILRGQWLALRRQFLKPVVVAVILELVLMISIRHIQPRDDALALSVWLAGIFMLLADVFTLGWCAMSAALTEKSQDRATLKTAAYVLALPWALFAAVEPMTYLWSILISRKPWQPGDYYYLAWWFGFGFFLDLFFLLRARRRVKISFRRFAVDASPLKTRFRWLAGLRAAVMDGRIPLSVKLRRLAIGGVVLLVAGTGAGIWAKHAFSVKLPDPIVVSVNQNSQPMRVFSGQGGFLFVMPDGSLWSWVHSRGEQSGIVQPEQIGTNRDWVQASLSNPNAVGLRSDGTLWDLHLQDGQPIQIGDDHDWIDGRAGTEFILARKRDGTLWARGDLRSLGLNSAHASWDTNTNIVPLGTNRDWKAMSTSVSTATVLALRADNTLWIGGDYNFYTNGIWSHTNYSFPHQLCQESNWVGIGDGFLSSVHNQQDEWWSFWPFRGLPGTNVSVASIGQLAISNSGTVALGPFFSNTWSWVEYQIQSGGTMGVIPFTWPVIPLSSQAFRFGHRSDWTSIWGGNGTLLGLTSDGMMWTWGLDFGQERHYDLGERFDLVRTAVSNALGNAPRPGRYDEWGGRQPQKEPRPLLRVVVTPSVPWSSPGNLNPAPKPK